MTVSPGAFARAAWGLTLTPLILLPGIGMLVVGTGFLVFAWRRRVGLSYLVLGGVAWTITVALKLAWAINLNPILYAALLSRLSEPVGLAVFEVYVGLLTGVFEVALVWLILTRSRLGKASWNQVLGFGMGFGIIEALLLGFQALVSGLTALVAPEELSQAALAADLLAMNPLIGVAPIVERAATIWVHVLCASLIFTSIATNRRRWVVLAIVFKTAMDTVAAFAQFWGVETLGKLWSIEAALMVFGLVGWWGTQWLAAHYPQKAPPGVLTPEPLPLT